MNLGLMSLKRDSPRTPSCISGRSQSAVCYVQTAFEVSLSAPWFWQSTTPLLFGGWTKSWSLALRGSHSCGIGGGSYPQQNQSLAISQRGFLWRIGTFSAKLLKSSFKFSSDFLISIYWKNLTLHSWVQNSSWKGHFCKRSTHSEKW